MTTLAELFEESGSDTVNHRGRIVKAIVRIPVCDGAAVTVRRTHAAPERPQGLKLAVNTGVLDVNGARAPAVVLWSTTSPPEIVLHVRGAGARTIEVWNCWSMGGVDSAWIGNAGIVTKTTPNGLILRCSDGIGAPDFCDLEAEIEVDRSPGATDIGPVRA